MRKVSMLALALALAVGACGGGGSAEDEVRAAWETATRAVADGNATEFCALVSAEGRREIADRTGGLECESAVRLLASRLNAREKDVIRTTAITEIEVEGGEATVHYATSGALAKVGFTGRTSMHRIDERWLLRGV